MAPTPDQDVAIGFVMALFYGLYLATFFHCLRWHLFTDEGWTLRDRKAIQWSMFTATCILFVLCTINRALELRKSMMQAADSNRVGSKGVDGETIKDKSLPIIQMLLCTDANLTSQLADSVLMYRLWRIYNKSTAIIAFPMFLWIGGFALTGLQAYVQIVQLSGLKLWLPVNMSIGPGIILIPFWASTIVLNVYATSMIIRRLYQFSRDTFSSESTHSIKFVASLIIESGALYLVAGIAHFVAWWTPNDFAIAVISNINIPVIGIAFNLIIIRLAQHRAEEDRKTSDAPVSEIQFQYPDIKSHNIQEHPLDNTIVQFNTACHSDASASTSHSSFTEKMACRRNNGA
jgi:hypothetical protein